MTRGSPLWLFHSDAALIFLSTLTLNFKKINNAQQIAFLWYLNIE